MSDTTDFQTLYETHNALLRQANELNKEAVFAALEAAGLTAVTVTFDGEGDSGQIEDITAHCREEARPLPETTLDIKLAHWGSATLESHHASLGEAIDTLCFGYLSQEHDGWENNDGAFGEFTFYVSGRRIGLEFNARFTDFATIGNTF
jgi:hypothetical protein